MILAILAQNRTTTVINLANHQHQKKQKNEAAENCCNKAECERNQVSSSAIPFLHRKRHT